MTSDRARQAWFERCRVSHVWRPHCLFPTDTRTHRLCPTAATKVDDGWQECGAGSEAPTSFHDAAGVPLVNTSRFPDLRALVQYTASIFDRKSIY